MKDFEELKDVITQRIHKLPMFNTYSRKFEVLDGFFELKNKSGGKNITVVCARGVDTQQIYLFDVDGLGLGDECN